MHIVRDGLSNPANKPSSATRTGALPILIIFVAFVGLRGITAAKQSGAVQLSPAAIKLEVVSIKPNRRGGGKIGVTPTLDGFSGTTTVGLLIAEAFNTEMARISGGPDWIDSDRYDIDARIDPDALDAYRKLGHDERIAALRTMLQSVLVDRFKLACHSDKKVMTVYSLVVAKGRSKLKKAELSEPYSKGIVGNDGSTGAGAVRMDRQGEVFVMTAQAMTIDRLAQRLFGALGGSRPVVNQTGLTEKYDFTLRWQPEAPPTSRPDGDDATSTAAVDVPPARSAPTLFDALQQQLGLKLDSGKQPVEIIVVGHVEKPSDN